MNEVLWILLVLGVAFIIEFLRCFREVWKEDHATYAEIISYWENLRWRHKTK